MPFTLINLVDIGLDVAVDGSGVGVLVEVGDGTRVGVKLGVGVNVEVFVAVGGNVGILLGVRVTVGVGVTGMGVFVASC